MIIQWDHPKRLSNLAKHGLDFADLSLEFFLRAHVGPARDGRYKALGELGDNVVVVVFKPLGSEALSLISVRRASKKEREALWPGDQDLHR